MLGGVPAAEKDPVPARVRRRGGARNSLILDRMRKALYVTHFTHRAENDPAPVCGRARVTLGPLARSGARCHGKAEPPLVADGRTRSGTYASKRGPPPM